MIELVIDLTKPFYKKDSHSEQERGWNLTGELKLLKILGAVLCKFDYWN